MTNIIKRLIYNLDCLFSTKEEIVIKRLLEILENERKLFVHKK